MKKNDSSPLERSAVYSAAELQQIKASGLPVYGDLNAHPALQLGNQLFRPIFFLEQIKKLNIEATNNKCNLRCPFCYHSASYHNSRRKETLMTAPLPLLKQIVDQLPNLQTVIPYSINEPGLVPENMRQFLAYCWEKRQTAAFISTNLSLPWRNYESWIGLAGIEKIILGAGGIRQETHEIHRIGSSWERFLANIERLVALRKQTGWPKQIEYQVIITKHNEHEIEEIAPFVQRLGLDSIQYKTLARKTLLAQTLLPEEESYRRDSSQWLDQPCGYAFEGLTIVLSDHNGRSAPGLKVALCVCGYFDPPDDQLYIRGDLTQTALFVALNDPLLQKARLQQLTAGMGALSICQSCDSRKPLEAHYTVGGTLRREHLSGQNIVLNNAKVT